MRDAAPAMQRPLRHLVSHPQWSAVASDAGSIFLASGRKVSILRPSALASGFEEQYRERWANELSPTLLTPRRQEGFFLT